MTEPTTSEAEFSPSGKPWKLKFDTVDQVKEHVATLRSTPHQSIGQWTLPQISRHVGETITKNVVTPRTPSGVLGASGVNKREYFERG